MNGTAHGTAHDTAENVVHCRRAADWQTPERQPWTEKDHDEATTKADDLNLKVYGLASMLKVCAFAAESRRVLTEIEEALSWRDKARESLRIHVNHMTHWQELHDTSGEALQFIAGELTAAMEASVDMVYSLSSARLHEHKRTTSGQAQAAAGRAA